MPLRHSRTAVDIATRVLSEVLDSPKENSFKSDTERAGSMPPGESFRIKLVQEGQHNNAKLLVFQKPVEIQQVLDTATNKFRRRIRSLQLVDGRTLDQDLLSRTLDEETGVTIVCSQSVPTQQPEQVAGDDSAVPQTDIAATTTAPPEPAAVSFLCQRSLVEDDAISQLQQVVRDFACVRLAVGMPDLHPGARFPIGAVFGTSGSVMPFLVGGDVGCGMSLFPTGLSKVSAKKAERWAEQVQTIDGPWDSDTSALLEEQGVAPTDFDRQLGTVGGGNHFAELQAVDRVVDGEWMSRLDLSPQGIYLLVHSGSRSLGQHVLHQHLDDHKTAPLEEGTPAFETYMQRHDHAVKWAGVNRRLIALRMLRALGLEQEDLPQPLLDVCHNCVVRKQGCPGGRGEDQVLWLHRKGAAPIDQGPVVIPGSRGAFSFLVAPSDDQHSQAAAGFSVAHGAGRKWSRSHAHGVGQSRYPNPKNLTTTDLGGQVVCDDVALLYEEQPDAYKEIQDIIDDLEAAHLVQAIAVMRPVLTYKTRARFDNK